MSKKENEESQEITISADALQALIRAEVSKSRENDMREFANTIAAAIQESKKPFVHPGQEANDKAMRESMHKQAEEIKARIKASQASCQHLQGSNPLSRWTNGLTSIAQHVLDNGVVVGICTNCLRQFWPSDPDYLLWMQKKSGNVMSEAGRRYVYQPQYSVPAAPAQVA